MLPSWEKYQNVDGLDKVRKQTRDRVSNYRENQKLKACHVTVALPVTVGNGTEEEKKKKKIPLCPRSLTRARTSLKRFTTTKATHTSAVLTLPPKLKNDCPAR